MSTLLLRFAAPLQSWGDGSKFTRRETRREPTKSGVVGMLAAALGRSREDSIADLAALKFGVRIERGGTLLRDYHTAHTEAFWSDGAKGQSFVSDRYYLADAVFLVGLEGDDTLLDTIENALNNPYYPIYLGRRSCPPTGRLVYGRRNLGLVDALTFEQSLCKTDAMLEIVVDDREGTVVRDLPLSFSQRHRRYGYRTVTRRMVMPRGHDPIAELDEHDPLSELGGDE